VLDDTCCPNLYPRCNLLFVTQIIRKRESLHDENIFAGLTSAAFCYPIACSRIRNNSSTRDIRIQDSRISMVLISLRFDGDVTIIIRLSCFDLHWLAANALTRPINFTSRVSSRFRHAREQLAYSGSPSVNI